MRCIYHALDRDQIGHGGVGVNTALHHVQEVELACLGQFLRNQQTVLSRDPALLCLISSVTETNDEFFAYAFAHGVQHVHRETHAVLKGVCAVGTNQIIGQGRPELIE